MKSLVTIVIWALFTTKVIAQPAAHPVSLVECLDMALTNSATSKNGELDRQGFELRLRESRSAAYPQISAKIGYDYSPVLPTQLLPGELFGQADGTYIPPNLADPGS